MVKMGADRVKAAAATVIPKYSDIGKLPAWNAKSDKRCQDKSNACARNSLVWRTRRFLAPSREGFRRNRERISRFADYQGTTREPRAFAGPPLPDHRDRVACPSGEVRVMPDRVAVLEIAVSRQPMRRNGGDWHRRLAYRD